MAVLPCPLADSGGLLAIRANRLLRNRGLPRSPSAATAACLSGSVDVGGEGATELRGVVVRQVDLVTAAVEREVKGARRFRSVEVVDEPDCRLLCRSRTSIR